jgi:hypothetical protein
LATPNRKSRCPTVADSSFEGREQIVNLLLLPVLSSTNGKGLTAVNCITHCPAAADIDMNERVQIGSCLLLLKTS